MTNWASHFRQISKAGQRQAEFGTIAGQYTVAELKDLITAKDSDMANLAAVTAQFFPTWQRNNPNDANAWHADYAKLLSRYSDARTKTNLIINGGSFSLIPDSMIPADDTYKTVLAAINPSWQSNTNAPDSLGGLNARIGIAGGSFANAVPTPQPIAPDFDLHQMTNVNQITNALPQPIKTAVGTIAPGLAPTDKSGAQFKPFDAKQFAKDHWEGLTIGGVGLVVILKIMAKIGL